MTNIFLDEQSKHDSFPIVMSISDEKIADLKKVYISKIEEAHRQMEVWNSVVTKFKTKLEVLNELVVDVSASQIQHRVFGEIGKYKNMETTPAVLAVIENSAEALATSDIIRILEDEGFNTRSKHWKAAVFTACGRLAAKGRILVMQRGGKAAYMRRQETLVAA